MINFIQLNTSTTITYPVGVDLKRTISIVKDMAEKIKNLYPVESFPALQFYLRGSSGAILGGIISTMLSDYIVRLNHIKKDKEESHSGSSFDYDRDIPSIILDDLIATASTVNIIEKEVSESTGDFKVDLLCVSGHVNGIRLRFKPKHIIAGNFTP